MRKFNSVSHNTFATTKAEGINISIRSPPNLKDTSQTNQDSFNNTEHSTSAEAAEVSNKLSDEEIELSLDDSLLSEQLAIEEANHSQSVTDEASSKSDFTSHYQENTPSQPSNDQTQTWWATNSTTSKGSHSLAWILGGAAGLGSVVLIGGSQSKDSDDNNSRPVPKTTLQPPINQPVSVSDDIPNDDPTNDDPVNPSPTPDIILDTTIDQPTLTLDDITGNNSLDDELAHPIITITGQLTDIDADVDATQTSVTLTINSKSVIAVVTGNNFSAEVDSSDLKADDKITAQVTVTDKHGNTAISETVTKTYILDLDTTINQPTLTLDDISGDNSLDDELANSTITITGQLTDIDADVDTTQTNVILTINGKFVFAVVTGNNFSAEVDSSDLKADNKITAQATVTDKHGNTAVSETIIKSYLVAVEPVTITIDSISIENSIDVNEVQEDLVIRGKVSSVNQNQIVEIKINDTTFDTEVNSKGTFNCRISGLDLKHIEDYAISVQIKGNTDLKSAHTHDVSEYMAPSITIIDVIDNEVNIGSHEPLIRLSGKIDLSGTAFDNGGNNSCVKAINIKVGDTIYRSGITEENQSFYIDVKRSDISQSNSSSISYTLETSDKILEISNLNFGDQYHKIIELTKAPTLDDTNTSLIIDQSSTIKLNDTSYQTQINAAADEILTTKVTGIARGPANAGDKVTIEVDGRIYTTLLNSDKSFSIEIDVDNLSLTDTIQIKANLITKDSSNNAINVSDECSYTPPPVVDDTMVSWTGKLLDYQDLPYFIQALDVETLQSDYFFGYLKNHEHGNESGKHTITYHIATSTEGTTYSSSKGELLNPTDYTRANQSVITESLNTLQKYIDVEFKQVDSMDESDITYYMANINGGVITPNTTYLNGYAVYGKSIVLSSEVFGDHLGSMGSLDSYTGFSTVFHETMHSLGARHPFEGPEGSNNLDATLDSKGLSLMSYNKNNDFNGAEDLRIYDIAYLQYRFGVNPNERVGDDIYTFKTFNPLAADGDIYIWDGGGVDTFNASQEQAGIYVNLTPGSDIYNDKNNIGESLFAVKGELTSSAAQYFPDDIDKNDVYMVVEKIENSDSYTIHNDIPTVFDFTEGHSFIGYGTQIENLIGSAFNDTLIGNKANNFIYGGEGEDVIDGGAGNNYLAGGAGNDKYIIQNNGDTIIELMGNGDDFVFSSAQSHELDSNVENLILMDSAVSGIGNALDNTIVSNNLDNVLKGGLGNDILISESGNDILTGGLGADTFVFNDLLDNAFGTIIDFNTEQGDTIQLDSTLFSNLNPNNPSSLTEFVNYDGTTGVLSYDNGSSGTTNAIHFATISQGLTLEENWFSVI